MNRNPVIQRAFYLLLVLTLGPSAFAAADEAAAKIDPDKVPVAKDDKGDQSFEEMSGKTPAKKPVSLSKKDKEATVKRVRTLAGVEKSNLAAVPPALITLSPDILSQGNSWLGMLKGAIRPKYSEKDVAYMTIGPKDGVFLLHFEPMVPGSPYLLDCEVSAYPEGKMIWEVHGAFNGVIEDQEGHLLIGFIAADKSSNLSISRHSGVAIGHLFKCELTRVD
jgi:hypothetical protein